MHASRKDEAPHYQQLEIGLFKLLSPRIAAVSRVGRLILFDRRGVGLSHRVGARPTVDATAKDILAVMDAAGSRRALLMGSSEGGPGCIRFAVDHPDRLVGLVLWGSLAKGSHAPDYRFALTAEQYNLWKRRLIANWGGPAEIETFAPSLVGDRQAEAWWAGLLRAASSPGAVTGMKSLSQWATRQCQLPLPASTWSDSASILDLVHQFINPAAG